MNSPKLPSVLTALFIFIAFNSVARAQSFSIVANFNGGGSGPVNPYAALIQAPNGYLYGTEAGDGYGGTVYNTAGGVTNLYYFCSQSNCTDGEYPQAPLALGTNDALYGTTSQGGTNGEGTIFRVTLAGLLTTLYNFCSQTNCADGASPTAGLVLANNGNSYGTTLRGGNYSNNVNGAGTVFEISPRGVLRTLHSFCAESGCPDGLDTSGLIQATDGDFYGTTAFGGTHGGGTVYKISPAGKFRTLYSFCAQTNCADGSGPTSGLIQGSNGNFYGTSASGGANNMGAVFEITPTGTLTTLHSFDGSDGNDPLGVVQANDGNFYGATVEGGSNNNGGTLFEVSPAGEFKLLFAFCSSGSGPCRSGEFPFAGLFQATDGLFYGTASAGGAYEDGTIFSYSHGLGPFVQTVPTAAKIGTSVEILGYNLTGSTGVTFNGTAASFSVVSSTEIKATVPAGATSGRVTVTTPTVTLKGNPKFQVLP